MERKREQAVGEDPIVAEFGARRSESVAVTTGLFLFCVGT